MNKIPEKFNLMGFEITVERDPYLMSKKNAFGLCIPTENKIIIQEYVKGMGVSKAFLFQTFFHELGHMYMSVMNEPELYENEKFIDILGSLMFQFNKSSK